MRQKVEKQNEGVFHGGGSVGRKDETAREKLCEIVVRVGTTPFSLTFSLHDCALCSVLNPQ